MNVDHGKGPISGVLLPITNDTQRTRFQAVHKREANGGLLSAGADNIAKAPLLTNPLLDCYDYQTDLAELENGGKATLVAERRCDIESARTKTVWKDANDLNKEKVDLDGKVCELNDKAATLDGEVTDLKEQVSGLKAQVDALRTENATLHAENAALSNQVTNLGGEVADLKSQVTTLTNQFSTLIDHLATRQ